jgi:signal peptidase I
MRPTASFEPTPTAQDAVGGLATLLGDGPHPAPRAAENEGGAVRRPARNDRANRPLPAARLLRDVVIGALLVVALNLFVVQVSIVRGHSMQPFLEDGDRLVVDKTSTGLSSLARFDVVVMESPKHNGVDYVKRVVGLPGERVALRRGVVWIDGKPIDEDFSHIADDADTREWKVPPGHLFVLGDNRPVSADSREFGLVPGDLVRGKVRARLWPLDRVAIWP